MAGWEHFEHQADIGVRGWGESLEEAFEQAALALVRVAVEPGRVTDSLLVMIRCEAPDRELLLVDWLNALVREMSARRVVFCRFRVTLAALKLEAEAWGELIDTARHLPAVEVKGASYQGLWVGQDASGRWVAQCVVDV